MRLRLPTAAQLAVFRLAVGAGIPFKATAGLHQDLRYRDPVPGFDHHGFLNLPLPTQPNRGRGRPSRG